MALYPKARYRPVSGLANDPPIIPIGVILHVRAGTGDSLFGYFNGPSGGVESHTYLTFDGHWEQYRDTTREADAQGDGNSFIIDGKRYGFISVETEGGPNGTWTPTQLDELVEFIRWAAAEHHFPLRKTPAWNRAGVGYHSLFDQWNHNAHTCPGPERIKQFNAVILPRMEDDDMPTARELWGYDQNGAKRQAWSYLQTADANARSARIDAAKTLAIVEALAAKPQGLTADEIAAAAQRGAEAAIDAKIDGVDADVRLVVNPDPSA